MRKFKTESKKLLDLMINSIYTNREIFLRELISNASDAIDKLYFKSLTDTSVQVGKDDLAIHVSFDRNARTITVTDNGIGMTKDELDKDLGIIAHSDSFDFKAENAEDAPADIDIIGQFGVGFYSSFMVASSVRVVSRAYGSDEAWAWESDGVEGYDIKEAQRDSHGTDIILHIKPDTEEESYDTFLSEAGLKDLIKRYSNYVRYPIKMEVTKSRMKQPAEGEEVDPNARPEFENYVEEDTINSMIPIWKRKKSDVEDEEYNEFYRQEFHAFDDPARVVSMHAEGALTYDALVFIPSIAPYDIYSKDYAKGLALYSSNVLIMDHCAELVPDYFNFVRGVVDSSDLTLNISRETLQHNSQLKAIERRVTKKVRAELIDMRDNDREAYEKFFDGFGVGFKYGIYSSYGQDAETLADLLLFHSAKQGKLITLDEYIAAMPEDQKDIYFTTGDSFERLAKMPIVKTVTNKGYDVLLCDHELDDFCLMALREYQEKPFKDVAGEDLGLETEEEKKAAEEAREGYEGLFEAMQDTLGDKVESVTVSTRLTDEPVCITTTGGVSLKMEKTLKGVATNEEAEAVKSHRVLEVNANHPIFETMKAAYDAGQSEKIALYTNILYNQALLVEGVPIEDPIAFASAVCELMA